MKPISLLLVSMLAGCGIPGGRTTARSTPALRVATYNLNYGLAGDPETLAAIAETDADVLVLQEVSVSASSHREATPRRSRATRPPPRPGAGRSAS